MEINKYRATSLNLTIIDDIVNMNKVLLELCTPVVVLFYKSDPEPLTF